MGARFPIKKFGETSWLTYQQAGETSKAFGRGLLELGMCRVPTPLVYNPSKVKSNDDCVSIDSRIMSFLTSVVSHQTF